MHNAEIGSAAQTLLQGLSRSAMSRRSVWREDKARRTEGNRAEVSMLAARLRPFAAGVPAS
jgi:hypothetical protein